ncbi:MAG: hypothetical protein VB023_02335 [Oscillibacter sp.]|nr:hypothetical protein [Oscillibacter sp.]
MMIEEFEKRTGFYPSANLYESIEKAYMDSKVDKDAFCEVYKQNADGLAEKIRREVYILPSMFMGITLHTYSHVMTEMQQDAAGVMDHILRGSC